MIKMADESAASAQGNDRKKLDSILVRVADEIRVLSAMARTFSLGMSGTCDMQDQGSQTHTGEEPYLTVLQQAGPSISHVAETYNKNEVRLSTARFRFLGWGLTDALAFYIAECVNGVGEVSRWVLAR
jgi:hypothetical protein